MKRSPTAIGIPTALGTAIYIGRDERFLVDSRAPLEENVPYVIDETQASELQSGTIFIRGGQSGDRVVMIYRV